MRKISKRVIKLMKSAARRAGRRSTDGHTACMQEHECWWGWRRRACMLHLDQRAGTTSAGQQCRSPHAHACRKDASAKKEQHALEATVGRQCPQQHHECQLFETTWAAALRAARTSTLQARPRKPHPARSIMVLRTIGNNLAPKSRGHAALAQRKGR